MIRRAWREWCATFEWWMLGFALMWGVIAGGVAYAIGYWVH